MLYFRPDHVESLWLLLALGSIALMHAVYWVFTHPVNNFWLQEVKLKAGAAQFFALGSGDRNARTDEVAWTRLRDRWEWSHVARAALAACGLIFVAIS